MRFDRNMERNVIDFEIARLLLGKRNERAFENFQPIWQIAARIVRSLQSPEGSRHDGGVRREHLGCLL